MSTITSSTTRPHPPVSLLPQIQLNTSSQKFNLQQSGGAQDNTPLNVMSEDERRRCSWQYYGYPAFARHMASSHDFFLLRRFAPLQARCLLFLQNEIGLLEKKLKDWDDFATKQTRGEGQSGSFSKDPFKERTVIIQRLLPLLKEYNDLVDSFAKIRTKPTAVRSQIISLDNWFATYYDAIDPDERHWQDQDGDLFPLVDKPKTALGTFFQQSRLLKWMFKTQLRTDHPDPNRAAHWSGTAFEVFTTTVILILGLGLLFGPVWWLNFVTDNIWRLAIVTCFSAVFTGSLWLAAGNKPFEILGATAAYTAVLMIYRQLGNS